MSVQVTVTDRHDRRHVHTKISAEGVQTFTVEDVHIVVANVTGADLMQNYDKGKPWRPDMIRMEYRCENGGEWQQERPRVSGWYVKKDGSNGQRDASATLWDDDFPEWVDKFIGDNTPASPPSISHDS
jgi:hypothetical protein